MTAQSPELLAPAGSSPAMGRPGSLSYQSYIEGRDVPGTGWAYTVSARSLLEDVFTAVTLKRSLELDADDGGLDHPYIVGRCAIAPLEDVDRAVDAAEAAFPAWCAVPAAERLRLGERFVERLRAEHDRFIELLIAEGHPRRLAEWEFTCLLHVFSPESIDWYRRQLHTEFDKDGRRLIVRRQPDGVVGVNPPQNAPTPSAALTVLILMAGNTAVVRAPRSIALSTMWLLRDVVAPLLDELGAPAGTLNVLCGAPAQMVDRWLAHPGVDDVFYIGGSQEGLELQRRCVAAGKKPILELAGNDGLVVWRDADLALAAEAITECFFGSGQICMVPKYVLVHPAVADELLEELLAVTAGIRPGFPEEPDVLLAPVRRSEKFLRQLEQALAQGARLCCGGRRLEVDGTATDTGVFLEPTVLRVDGMRGARELDVVRHETFYPMIPVVVAEDEPDDLLLERFVEFLNANEYGLRNSVWASAPEVVDRFVAGVRNGGLLKVNDSHIGFLPILPSHGGTGLTGGAFGEANYPVLRTSHLQGVSVAHVPQRPRVAVFGDEH